MTPGVETPMEEAVRYIVNTIGERFGGTENERKTARYLRDRFQALGLPVELQRVDFIGWEPTRPARVTLLEPELGVLAAAPLLYSAATPEEGVTGRLVRRGQVHLIPGVMELPCFDLIAADGTRLASIVVESRGPAIPLINPRPMYQLPQVVIGADDYKRLDTLISRNGDIMAQVDVGGRLRPDAYTYNTICHLTKPDARSRLIISAHMDTTINTPGAYDNASGLGALVGLAQALKDIDPPYGIDLIGFACEELGFIGSAYYVNDLKERGLLNQVKACVNLDMLSGGEILLVWAGPDAFQNKIAGVLRRRGMMEKYEVHLDTPKPGADDWLFFIEGIPAATLLFWRQDVYHKPIDTVDRMDWQRVRDVVSVVAELAREL